MFIGLVCGIVGVIMGYVGALVLSRDDRDASETLSYVRSCVEHIRDDVQELYPTGSHHNTSHLSPEGKVKLSNIKLHTDHLCEMLGMQECR